MAEFSYQKAVFYKEWLHKRWAALFVFLLIAPSVSASSQCLARPCVLSTGRYTRIIPSPELVVGGWRRSAY